MRVSGELFSRIRFRFRKNWELFVGVIDLFLCSEWETLKKCFVRTLEKCEESTPANLVEAMFKFVRKETTCANH